MTLNLHAASVRSCYMLRSSVLTSCTIAVGLVGRDEGRVLERGRVVIGSSYAVQSSPEARRAYVPFRCMCTHGPAPFARIPRHGPWPAFPHDNWRVCTCPGRTRLARHACCAPRCARAARLVASRARTNVPLPSRFVTPPPRLQAWGRTRSRTRRSVSLPVRCTDACGARLRARRIASYSGSSLSVLARGLSLRIRHRVAMCDHLPSCGDHWAASGMHAASGAARVSMRRRQMRPLHGRFRPKTEPSHAG